MTRHGEVALNLEEALGFDVRQAVLLSVGLTLLEQPKDARTFEAVGTRLVPGTALPKPQGVFPRYVEPEAE